ncbi:dynein intermediate chain 3, ciliary-like [Trichoplusia ni]|uniref:Dynein intermediate chain 3, ciliary-like n=1 Tax=Trichoplusia ni TaxID=7111 RepID=A0A7E5V9N0_TRINI|nr:dynein intermediate chain 3, ciliary-like [Trichoplusia ni]
MSSYVKWTYEYTKVRKNFGRQPLFQIVPARMLDSINPDISEQKNYILRNPVHREVQAASTVSWNETNTKRIKMHDQGIDHTEGGWPKEVHPYNEDHVQRHRRRIMHEDSYIHSVLNLSPALFHRVDQNNAIEMYETYYSDMPPQDPVEKYGTRITNVFRDENHRPISCVKWTNEKNAKLAVAYCFQTCMPEPELNKLNACYIWDVHRQTEPVYRLEPEHPCGKLACSPANPDILICGLENGTVALFDVRTSKHAVSTSSVYNSHRRPITSILYIHSRTHTDFFTGSSDGECLWWDLRNLSYPFDRLSMSVRHGPTEMPNLSNSEGVSTLEFDPGLPTKFLCGTETGLVINGNRMGRSHDDILVSYWNAHDGSVQAVQRSPCTFRMFLTCGDFTVKVWSEEVRTEPIIVTRPYKNQVTDAAWAPLRFSCYMSVCAGGMFYYWDLLRKYKEPVVTLQVSKYGLTRITPHIEGESVAIGDYHGDLYLLQLSENMSIPGSRDKLLMGQVYERETKREHILDNRLKEIRLKARAEEEAAALEVPVEETDEEELVQAAEDEFFRIVQGELKNMEIASEHTE